MNQDKIDEGIGFTFEPIEPMIVLHAIDILCLVCAGDRNTVINKLTGYLWDEEEAGNLKTIKVNQ